ncbi:hypothetical protein Lser_V15G11169 [Lactuca serriola]
MEIQMGLPLIAASTPTSSHLFSAITINFQGISKSFHGFRN